MNFIVNILPYFQSGFKDTSVAFLALQVYHIMQYK